MSNHQSRRPSAAKLEVGDVTERNELPPGLRYPPQGKPAASAAPPARARVHQPHQPSTSPSPQPQMQRQPELTRKPKATPAPLDQPLASRSNVIPFLRPNQPVSMVVSAKPAAPTANVTRPMVSQAPPGSKSQMRAAVVVSQPGQNGQPPQMTAAAVFSTPNGTHVAVAMPTSQPQPMPQSFGAMPMQAPTFYQPAPLAQPPGAPPAAPPVVHDLPSSAVQSAPWVAYEKLGLGQAAVAAVHQKTSKLVVSAYRLLGFFILTLIVALLVGYITESIFYFVSDSWIQPMVVSKGDDKIVSLSSQLAEQQNTRDRIASDLSQAEQAIARQQEFQTQFMNTVRADLGGRKLVLGKLRGIAGQYANAGASVTGTNSSYAAAERARMQREYAAGLIDRRAMMAGNFQGAQITTSSLGIAEKRVETEARADELQMQVTSLESILADKDASGVLSYEILKIKQEYDNSKLEMNKAIANRDSLKASLERQDEIVKGLSASSYLRALKDNASVAFVPYGNMKGMKEGVSLYGCKLGMVVCHKVGKVIQVLPGEIQGKHPHRDKMLRGQLVEISIEDGAAAQDDVLFVGGKPMLF